MKTTKFILLFILLSSIFFSCKKSENDPFISLKSRKARITGEWKLTEGYTEVTSATGTDTYTITGGNITSVENGISITQPYSEVYNFKKDGTYNYTCNTDNGNDVDFEEGSWTFGTKSADMDLKAKETVLLYIKHYSSDNSGNNYSYTYDGTIYPVHRITLDMLKNKKMTIIIDYTYQDTNTSYTRKGTMTYEKQ
ncbi:MAG TPA: hypothetical protein PKK00_12190 [Bacteroidales bacterium]|nr:hypothetical protein [Bacteroidales bacterium]HPS17810.1 hypothetical protein [Bacteroidales bacterium]